MVKKKWKILEKNNNGQEKKKLSTKKVKSRKNDNDEGMKQKTQIIIQHLASFFRYIQFGLIEK